MACGIPAKDRFDWNRRVEAWEEVAATPAFVALRERICAEAAATPDDRVVDLGAGTGLLALELAPPTALSATL
jgi:predicted RNA methylase